MRIKYFLIEILNLDMIDTLMNAKWSYINILSQGKLLNSIVREVGAFEACMRVMATQMTTVFKLIVLCTMPIYLYQKFINSIYFSIKYLTKI